MQNFTKVLMIFILGVFLGACAGGPSVQSISVPVVQEIAYKDIVSCKKVDASFSDCLVKDPKTGLGLTVRIQTAKIPKKGAE